MHGWCGNRFLLWHHLLFPDVKRRCRKRLWAELVEGARMFQCRNSNTTKHVIATMMTKCSKKTSHPDDKVSDEQGFRTHSGLLWRCSLRGCVRQAKHVLHGVLKQESQARWFEQIKRYIGTLINNMYTVVWQSEFTSWKGLIFLYISVRYLGSS